MALTIWKATADVSDVATVTLPEPCRVIHIEPDGPTRLTVWLEVDPALPLVTRRMLVVGTGNPIPDEAGAHLASVLAPPFVWHVYAWEES